MPSIRKTLMAAAVALAAAPTAADANGGRGQPFRTQPHPVHTGPTLFVGHRNANLPAFQAAPWYLYWPYDGHFMTPAPIHGPFHAPPVGGNFPVNPYFPAPHGYYGPMPGGPAPGGVGPGIHGVVPGHMPPSPGVGGALPPIPPMPAGVPVPPR